MELARWIAGPVESARVHRAERAARLEAERSALNLRRLQANTAELAGALTSVEVAEAVVKTAVAAFNGAAGMVAVPSADGERLEIISYKGYAESVVLPLRHVRLDEPTPATTAYLQREPEIIETFAEFRARYPDFTAITAQRTGTRALLCVPLLLDGKAIGVLGVTYRQDRRFSPDERAFALILAAQCAQALDRARLYSVERRAAEHNRLLAEAGEVLSSSLNYETTLQNVACMAMPVLADFCFFDVIEGAEVRRLARAYANPRVEALLGEARWARAEVEAESPAHIALLRELGLRSMIRVSLLTRTETLGALTFCFAESGRHHTPADFSLATDLGRRAAMAVENARLHRASQEATRQAEQANRAKDDFLGLVSHELRAPLNAILGWAQLLRGDKANDPAMIAKAIAVIERNATAQAKLIEDILDVSRIISGKLRLELRALDLESVVRCAVEVVRPVALAKRIELKTALPPNVIVSGDPDRLQQVVWNLLSNAVKFTPRDGLVEIRLERRERRARIVVCDSGLGIQPVLLPHVFDRFWQADDSTTRRHGGLGLGLAIVRHVVDLHGGSVCAESEGADRGSTFTVELPLHTKELLGRPPGALDDRDADLERSGLRLDGLKLLVVDDELDARQMLAALLTSAGAEVAVAGSASEAIEELEMFAADVLVSDVAMPGEDGYALIRRVRASSKHYARIPALALTAYAGRDDARRAELAGFHAHLPKPVELATLISQVEILAGRAPSAPAPGPSEKAQ